MNQVSATVTLDQEKGTVTFSMDLQGDSELDHEILAATIGAGRSVSIQPAHHGNELFAEFVIADLSIWPKASRALENRIRVRDGRPTLDEEEETVWNRVKAGADAEKAAAEAKEKAEVEAEEKQAEADKRLAAAVSSGIAAALSKQKS